MSRTLNFNQNYYGQSAFFKVTDTPVKYEDPFTKQFKNYPDKKIIINETTGEAISIVGSNFLPVAHENAFQLGIEIFEILFGITPQIHKEEINYRTTDYSVDLISEDCKIIFDNNGYRFHGNQQNHILREFNLSNTTSTDNNQRLDFIVNNFHDEYKPFIRISNYLREGNSFYIEVGYYRSRCTNGMMFGRKTKMTFRNNYRVLNFELIRLSAKNHFLKSGKNFMQMAEQLWKLLTIHISKAQFKLVTFDIYEKELIKKSINERSRLLENFNELVEKYVMEIGENLNAALNAATEFSKQLEDNRVSKSTLQNLPFLWMKRVTKKTFNIRTYLNEIEDIEKRVLNTKIRKEELEEIE
jgi:hypothetical protein